MKKGIWAIIECLTFFFGASFGAIGFGYILYSIVKFEFAWGCLLYIVGLFFLCLPYITPKFYPNMMNKPVVR